MRILVVSELAKGGAGGEPHMLALNRRLQAVGHEIRVLATAPGEAIAMGARARDEVARENAPPDCNAPVLALCRGEDPR